MAHCIVLPYRQKIADQPIRIEQSCGIEHSHANSGRSQRVCNRTRREYDISKRGTANSLASDKHEMSILGRSRKRHQAYWPQRRFPLTYHRRLLLAACDPPASKQPSLTTHPVYPRHGPYAGHRPAPCSAPSLPASSRCGSASFESCLETQHAGVSHAICYWVHATGCASSTCRVRFRCNSRALLAAISARPHAGDLDMSRPCVLWDVSSRRSGHALPSRSGGHQ
jgi:hypothetical protein